MENNQINISFSPETRALTLKVYQDNANRITKQLRMLHSKRDKLSMEIEKLEMELDGINTLIKHVSGEEPLNPQNEELKEEKNEVTQNSTSNPNNSSIQNEVNMPVENIPKKSPYFLRAEAWALETSGYNVYSRWDEKLDFVLKYAPFAFKRGSVAVYLQAIDTRVNRDYEDLLKTISPYLARMADKNQVVKAKDGTQGYIYMHPSWVENAEIKPEFKDRCPENIRIVL